MKRTIIDASHADALVKAQETGAIEKIETAVEKPEFYK